MKRFFFVLLAVAALSVPRTWAQDRQIFNHMALGPTFGTDGIGLDLVMPVGRHIQLRGGYAIDPIQPSFKVNAGSYSIQGTVYNFNDIPVKFGSWKNGTGHLLLDIYPSRKGGFHFSLGAFINNGMPLSASADLSKVLDPEDYGTLSLEDISTDKSGVLYLDLKTWSVMPYAGLGFGRALNPERTFGFVFDMGVLVWGSPQFQSYNYVSNTLNPSWPVEVVPITGEKVRQYNTTAADVLSILASIPVLPYMRFGFYFRLF